MHDLMLQLTYFSSPLTLCVVLWQEIATPKPEEPNLGFIGALCVYMTLKNLVTFKGIEFNKVETAVGANVKTL